MRKISIVYIESMHTKTNGCQSKLNITIAEKLNRGLQQWETNLELEPI